MSVMYVGINGFVPKYIGLLSFISSSTMELSTWSIKVEYFAKYST